MTRITIPNVIKVLAAVLFFILDAFLLLVIGLATRREKVVIEGAIYAAAFVIAVYALGGGPSAVLGLGAMALSIGRAFWLRDLWLPARPVARVAGNGASPILAQAGWQTPQPLAPAFVTSPQPSPAAPIPNRPTNDLSAALGWVSSTAKQNKHRLPPAAYVALLETNQTLDGLIDAEAQHPSGDAGFEYELEAMVRQYLPTVLQGFLRVPADLIHVRQANGKTPTDELLEQVGLLSRQAEALHARRHRTASAELSSMGNFLRERFGNRQLDPFDFGI